MYSFSFKDIVHQKTALSSGFLFLVIRGKPVILTSLAEHWEACASVLHYFVTGWDRVKGARSDVLSEEIDGLLATATQGNISGVEVVSLTRLC